MTDSHAAPTGWTTIDERWTRRLYEQARAVHTRCGSTGELLAEIAATHRVALAHVDRERRRRSSIAPRVDPVAELGAHLFALLEVSRLRDERVQKFEPSLQQRVASLAVSGVDFGVI